MSFQITVLKVLAGHPEGRATLIDLKHYVAVLTCSGADWSQRMKRLAARAPELNIFSSGYVRREPSGWLITQQGRDFLALIEAPSADPEVMPIASPPQVVSGPTELPTNVIRLAGHKRQRRHRRAAAWTWAKQVAPLVSEYEPNLGCPATAHRTLRKNGDA